MQSKSLVDELREAAPLLSVGILTADMIVTGSAVFDGKTPRENATFMIDAVRRTARESRHNDHEKEA